MISEAISLETIARIAISMSIQQMVRKDIINIKITN